jgi:hypothetical protein
MELRQYKNILLILAGITLIDLVISMASFSTVSGMVATNINLADIDDPGITRVIREVGLGVNPFRFGGAFGILLLILPFLFYNFVYHPTKSLTYMMLPASWLEKFMSAWMMCVIAVPMMLFAFSLLIGFVGDLAGAQVTYHSLKMKPFLINIYLPTIAMQSFFFLMVFWFKRKKIQKTILVVVIFIIAFFGVMIKIVPHIFEHQKTFFVDENQTILVATYTAYTLMTLFWTAALLKYPRTQI